jgi:hypothetical protein
MMPACAIRFTSYVSAFDPGGGTNVSASEMAVAANPRNASDFGESGSSRTCAAKRYMYGMK